jgi:hypothetical protein
MNDLSKLANMSKAIGTYLAFQIFYRFRMLMLKTFHQLCLGRCHLRYLLSMGRFKTRYLLMQLRYLLKMRLFEFRMRRFERRMLDLESGSHSEKP